MGIRDWSQTATGNAAAAGINWAEGQAPSTVNNSAREMMAQLRQEYTGERWGWIAQSGTASVASQTTVKVAGDITGDAVANRPLKLTGGSTTVYANVLSSSFTTETTITLENATGSLSASHQIAWLGAVYDKNIPADVIRGTSSNTFSNPVVFGGSVSFSASARFNSRTEFNEKAAFLSSASFSNTVNMAGAVNVSGAINLSGGGVVSSATLSVAAGMLTVDGSPVGGGAAGSTISTINTDNNSGSWSAYTTFEVFTKVSDSTASAGGLSVSGTVAIYTDGGTTPVLSIPILMASSGSGSYTGYHHVVIDGNGTDTLKVTSMPSLSGRPLTSSPTTTSTSGVFYVNTIRITTHSCEMLIVR